MEEPAQIPACRVVAFQPSWILKEGVKQRLPGAREDA